MLAIRVVVQDEDVLRQLREGRRQIGQSVKAGLLEGASKRAVPAVRAAAPHRSGRLAGSIVARSTTRSVYLTTSLRGKQGRYVGLINYGGTVRAEIRPRRRGRGQKHALKMPDGRFAARITTPRTYRASLFMQRGVEGVEGGIASDLQEAVLRSLQGGVASVLEGE